MDLVTKACFLGRTFGIEESPLNGEGLPAQADRLGLLGLGLLAGYPDFFG